jgi:hypothetical protein
MPVGFAAGAAAIAAVGAIAGGIAKSNMDSYQAKIAQLNEGISDQNADYSQQAGTVQAFNQALVSRGQGGKLKANQAAAGVDVNTGSAVAVQASQREAGLANVQQTTANANRQAYGYRAQATGFQAQSTMDRTASQNDLIAGFLSAAGSATGAAGDISGGGGGVGGGAPTWGYSGAATGADMGTTWPGFSG